MFFCLVVGGVYPLYTFLNKPGTRERLRKGLQILVDGLTGLTGLTGLMGLTELTGLTGLARCMYVCM